MMISPAQARAARALVQWSQKELANTSHVGLWQIEAFESGTMILPHRDMVALRAALGGAGVVFLAEGEIADGGPGVRMGALGTSTGQAVEQEHEHNDNLDGFATQHKGEPSS